MCTPCVGSCPSADTRQATDGFSAVVVRIGPADLPYVVHQYARHAFGLVMNRDLNAAVNLKRLAGGWLLRQVLQVDHVRPTA